jgi:hypothetical protein
VVYQRVISRRIDLFLSDDVPEKWVQRYGWRRCRRHSASRRAMAPPLCFASPYSNIVSVTRQINTPNSESLVDT